MKGAAIDIQSLSVGYSGEDVLSDISLSIAPAEFVALLGASGCGKTTLLRTLAGFIKARTGRILTGHSDITALPPDKRNMAMVFQSYALWPHMSVARNIGYGLKLRRESRAAIADRVEEMLNLLGLQGLGQRKVTQLSGGQRQRVALGRALAINPQVLLLDEPLSNLDARIRVSVRHEIKTLQSRLGITAIHVTHDREEAMVMADRIVILNAGRIEQQGSPETVYNRPASAFVAAFMGADNAVSLSVRRSGNEIRVEPGPYNDAASLAIAETEDSPGAHVACSDNGLAQAHFRSEAAKLLVAGEEAPPANLILRGQLLQRSYPGGFYRYAVRVGDNNFMIDDPRRLTVGDAVRIGLPAAALHLFSFGD